MPATPWEWENPIRKRVLTGRYRPRVQVRVWGLKPIIHMQCEEMITRVNMFDATKEFVAHVWRDMTVDDITKAFG